MALLLPPFKASYLCEYLPRVSTTTVIADPAISSVHRRQEQISVTNAGGDTYRLVLPTLLPVTSIAAKGQGLALTMAADASATSTKANFVTDTVKWSVADLAEKTPKTNDNHTYTFSFRCHHCLTGLIDSRDYKFHEMPLEYWYELMDVWHCHKPNNDQETTKNYTNIAPKTPTDILVGLLYLLLMPSNQNPRLEYTGDHWRCSHCHADLGHERINKWTIDLVYGDTIERYTKTEYWYLAMMDKVNMAVRKFFVDNWQVWVANVDVGATIGEKAYPHCLKLMYKRQQGETSDNDEVVKLEHADELFSQLGEITAKLPKQCQTAGEWNVSYLPLQ